MSEKNYNDVHRFLSTAVKKIQVLFWLSADYPETSCSKRIWQISEEFLVGSNTNLGGGGQESFLHWDDCCLDIRYFPISWKIICLLLTYIFTLNVMYLSLPHFSSCCSFGAIPVASSVIYLIEGHQVWLQHVGGSPVVVPGITVTVCPRLHLTMGWCGGG